MHMESYPLLIPLLILVPAIGAFINIFVGAKLTERVSAYIGIGAALFSFVLAVLIFSSQTAALVGAHHGEAIAGYIDGAQVVNPPFFDGWIRISDGAGGFNLDIPWQFRVDTLTTVMLLVVTGVGSLIHIYSMGYMHGDPKYSRFFAYLNMFFMFMLILVTANNYLMLFVGWEGVGLMSFLLIGFWWDKSAPTGWKNSNAARKAMILNRIGDFGVLMSVFMIFWTFGTLNFYQPGEIANSCFVLEGAHLIESENAEAGNCTQEFAIDDHGEEETDDHAEESASAGAITLIAYAGEEETDDHGGGASITFEDADNSRFESPELLGVFGQVEYMTSLPEGDAGRLVDFGPFSADIDTVLLITLLFMFLGVAGKSAQIPLFVWLPDAMAGPTPVSALMHAATMVTAGVFLLVRSSVMLDAQSGLASFVVAITGALTALVAGYMALGQWDIKRVLAYSTISQLGFMVAAVGIGAYAAAMFHLVTHALFKALLFLGSGSVIHGVEHGHHHVHEHHHGHGHDDHGDHHEEEFDPQDMRNMGGLRRRMPITYITYVIGTLALAGIFPFAGFWSKDEILAEAWQRGLFESEPLAQLAAYLVLGILLVAAAFTAFYMWRQVQMVFHGDPRTEAADYAPESVPSMTIPLIILAIGSALGGFINLPGASPFSGFLGLKDHEFAHWLEPSLPAITTSESLYFNWPLAIAATVIALGAIFFAHSIYSGNKGVVDRDEHALGNDPLYKRASTRQLWAFANARMRWDETYFRIFENPYNKLADFLANVVDWQFFHDYFHDSVIKRGYDSVANILSKPVDIGIIDMLVNGVGWVVSAISGRFRSVQTGYVRTYALAVLLGVVAVVVVMLLPLVQQILQSGA